jgi:hypothetical protein
MAAFVIEFKVFKPAGQDRWASQQVSRAGVNGPPIVNKSGASPKTIRFVNVTSDPNAPDLALSVADQYSRNAFEGPHDVPDADGFPVLTQHFVLDNPNAAGTSPFHAAGRVSARELTIREHIGIAGENRYQIFLTHRPESNGTEDGGPGDTEVDVEC